MSEFYLTLTSVVFECYSYADKKAIIENLTLTSVVFELMKMVFLQH